MRSLRQNQDQGERNRSRKRSKPQTRSKELIDNAREHRDKMIDEIQNDAKNNDRKTLTKR